MTAASSPATSGLHAAVVVHRGGFTLDVSLDVAPGEVLAVLGPNGSGKSTLLRALAGLRPVDGGHVRLGDRVLDDAATRTFVAPEHRNAAVVFQDHVLFRHLSVLENVAFGLRARGTDRVEARRRASEWLQRVGLGDRVDDRPNQLSGGQQQRVALARALVTNPGLLLLDEPLSSLDASTRRVTRSELRTHLDGYASRGGVAVLVTHDPVDAYVLADRVAVLEGGSIAQIGTISEVTGRPRSSYVAELVGTNLFRGTSDGTTVTLPGGLRLAAVEAPVGEVFALVRPQAVTVSLQAPTGGSARNVWSGIVTDVARLGERARVTIDLADGAGAASPATSGRTSIVAEVTSAALDSLGAVVGERVVATVKATEVGVYPA